MGKAGFEIIRKEIRERPNVGGVSCLARYLTCPFSLWGPFAARDRSDERPFFGGMAAKRLDGGIAFLQVSGMKRRAASLRE